MAKDKEQTMRLRFRRTISVTDDEGKTTTHAANSIASVKCSDDNWALVDRGDADLEPGPGIDGQPFPPDTLTEAPAPAAPPIPPVPVTVVPATTPAESGTDYEAMTVAELHEEATKRNIDGRSGLDKPGLIKALKKDDKKAK